MNFSLRTKFLIPAKRIFSSLVLFFFGCQQQSISTTNQVSQQASSSQQAATVETSTQISVQTQAPANTISSADIPLENAQTRVTKKFFGTKVSPGNSPVTPERFSGYHTGVDF